MTGLGHPVVEIAICPHAVWLAAYRLRTWSCVTGQVRGPGGQLTACPGPHSFGSVTGRSLGAIQQLFAAVTHKNALASTVLLGPLPGSVVVLGSRACT